MRKDNNEPVLYQIRSRNLLRAPTWKILSPSTQLLQNEVILGELRRKVSEINRVSLKAFKTHFLHGTATNVIILALWSIVLTIIMFSFHAIGFTVLAMWSAIALAVAFCAFVVLVFKANHNAIMAVKNYIGQKRYRRGMHNSWSFDRNKQEVRWNWMKRNDAIICCIHYDDIAIRFTTEQNRLNEDPWEPNQRHIIIQIENDKLLEEHGLSWDWSTKQERLSTIRERDQKTRTSLSESELSHFKLV